MRYLAVILATCASVLAPPASAAVLIDSVGQTFQVNYDGRVAGSSTDLISAEQVFTLNSVSADNKIYTFGYSLTNTSSVASRLRSFGFDVIGASVSSLSGSGLYSFSGTNENFPEGVGFLDACFKATSNGSCTGGQQGLTSGSSALASFSLTFNSATGPFSLDNFTTRFQSIEPAVNGSSSGVGIGIITAVPEVSTWGMMIMGFGLIGGVLRGAPKRRRQLQAA